MKTQFKRGQIYCSKYNPKTIGSKGHYYVVMQEESNTQNLVLQVINSNKKFETRWTIEPLRPDIDFEEVQIRASDLLFEEITIKETLFNELVYGKAMCFLGDDEIIKFSPVGDDLISNVQFEFRSTIKLRLKGHLYFDFYDKEQFLKSAKNE